jgi:hypothetical protein
MKTHFFCCLVAAVIAVVPGRASAQHAIYALVPQGYSPGSTPPTGPTSLVRVRTDGDRLGPIITLATIPGVGDSLSVTAGGRFVLWRATESGGCRQGLFDTALRTNTPLACWDTPPLIDPIRERVVFSAGGSLVAASIDGLVGIPNTQGVIPRAMSTDGRRVFALRNVNNASALEAIDVATGVVAWSTPLGGQAFKAVNEDESLVFVTANNSQVLRALEPGSGAVVREMATPGAGNPAVVIGDGPTIVDTASQRLVMALNYTVGLNPSTGAYWTVDLGTWTDLGTVTVQGPPRLVHGQVDADIFGTAQQQPAAPSSWPCGGSDFVRVVQDTGTVLPLGSIPGGPCVSWDVAFAPASPLLHAPSVAGASVTLAWTQPVGVTTGFVVEAGSAPRLSNLAALPVAAGSTTITVTNVPAGTYYVRLRALNSAGPSAPSNEITVVVP